MANTASGKATEPDSPALMNTLNVVAPATITAISDRSRPREMTTTAIPQARITKRGRIGENDAQVAERRKPVDRERKRDDQRQA